MAVESDLLPSGWEWRNLGGLDGLKPACQFLDHMRVPVNGKERMHRQGPFPYFGANGQQGWIDDYLFDEELVLLAEDGGFFFSRTKPASYRVSGKCWVNNHAHVLRTAEGVDPGWLNYCLAFADYTPFIPEPIRPKLNQANAKKLRVPCPPYAEQRRIVARIEELTTQLDQARRLHREAQDEFSRIILAAVHRFARDIAHEFRTLGEYLADRPRNGWSPVADAAEGSGAPVLTLSAVTGFRYDGTRVKWTSLPTRPDAHYWLAPGDLLITRSNTPELVGHAAIYDGTPTPCICSDLIMKMRVNPNKADVRFMHYWLQTGVARNHITSRARGTSGTMKKIAQNDVQEIPVPQVKLAEQRRIVAHLDGLSARARNLHHVQAEIAAELDSFTPALLAKAFRGEL